jgi:hypothetical protein
MKNLLEKKENVEMEEEKGEGVRVDNVKVSGKPTEM